MSELIAFMTLGFRHITDLEAMDHILFLCALAAIYRLRDWRDSLWVVSAFTVGHSVTLALAVTGAVCTAVACAVPGSIVAEAVGKPLQEARLGHPSGVLRVASRVSTGANGEVLIESAQIERTARLIMDGALFVRRRKIEMLAAPVKAT